MLKRIATVATFGLAMLTTAPIVAKQSTAGRAWTFEFVAIDGTPMPLAAFKGKVLLVVNTASFCGFTKQYEGLQALHAAYEQRGLVVIGVPSNDFGEQEPGSNAEIAQFCQGAFNVTFPLTEKQVVKGPAAHPFYRWAVETLGPSAAPGWNFHKYLIGADGALISSFPTRFAPQSPEVTKAIEAALSNRR